MRSHVCVTELAPSLVTSVVFEPLKLTHFITYIQIFNILLYSVNETILNPECIDFRGKLVKVNGPICIED